ncbi:MAG: Ppx/GppA family phosphatase [Candidatus Cloacimonetes bacterium]|nr:Ppx/GppA family phosphatase [Candidatus Cloacimonadota bacterium]
MPRYVILDIGTNSIKFYLAEIAGKNLQVIQDKNNITRLGEGLQKTGVISEEAITRNLQALKNFRNTALENDAKAITAVGTMCLRAAGNAADFIERVKLETGIEIEVIDGREEARLSYLAVQSTLGDGSGKVLVFDTGGGSTEFILGEGRQLQQRFSLNIGAVHPTEEFLVSDPVTQAELDAMLYFISDFFREHDLGEKIDYLVGVGGTVTTMASVMHKLAVYDPEIVQGSIMTRQELLRQMDLYRSLTIAERREITGLQAKRADIILAGTGIVKIIMDLYGKDKFTISDRGLRHGLMIDRYLSQSVTAGGYGD